MDRSLNREILRLALPSILANITIPLVGMVDTAIAGHIIGPQGSAAYIGGISVGAMIFNLIYWNFFFLRVGTGGLTAQAFGRGDMTDSARIFLRSIFMALAIAVVTVALQCPLSSLALLIVHGTDEVESLALQYFSIRIWAAPATLSLMAFRGWFVGMQDSVSSMWTDLIINAVNIVASILLAFGFGDWEGIGYDGIALGTVIAQYSGLLYTCLVVALKYRNRVFSHFHKSDMGSVFVREDIVKLTKMNVNLMLRSLGFTAIYMGFTIISASFGDILLACSSIMMQLLMIFSYFTDGFAYAGEALTGRFIGARDKVLLSRTVRYVFAWSMGVALIWTGIYAGGGTWMIKIITSDSSVVDACRDFLPWLIAMPLLGCPAFTWDGIYIGATESRPMRDAMLVSTMIFFLIWYVMKAIFLGGAPYEASALHILLAAYFAHLIFRTAYLSARKGCLNLS